MQHRHAVREPSRLTEEVGAQHDGAASLGRERADQVDDVTRGGRVEARRRLVEEQHLGIVQERPCERDALALPGREALHLVVGAVDHAEPLEQLVDAGGGLVAAEPSDLGGEARFSRAVSRSSSPAFSVSTPVRRRTSSPSATGSRPSTRARPRSGVEHAVEQANGRRLARAVRPEQREHLARRQLERQAVERDVRTEAPGEIVRLDGGGHGGQCDVSKRSRSA